jgi:hypothetical protein
MIFATPDFGAGAGAWGMVGFAWIVVLITVAIFVGMGLRLLQFRSVGLKCFGAFVLVMCGLVLLSCCFGPSEVVRLTYGNYPLGRYPNNKIKKGMTPDEVIGVLGQPHWREKSGNQDRWHYMLDAFDIGWFGVSFGADGRVESTYGD